MDHAHRPDPATEELLARLLHRDAAAWDELVRTYAPLLHGLSKRVFAEYFFPAVNADIEDAVAEVWGNLLEHDLKLVRQCAERGHLLSTLQVLVRHRSVDIMRRRKVRMQPLSDSDVLPAAEPDADVLTEADAAAMMAAVDALPARDRALVRLFFLQRRKYREIAELTGIPQNSIGPLLNRALKRLRAALSPPDVVAVDGRSEARAIPVTNAAPASSPQP